MKKITGLMLALVMAVTMTVGLFSPAMAASDTNSGYVEEGLVLWLDGFDTDSFVSDGNGGGIWTDKVSAKEIAVTGAVAHDGDVASGWTTQANGGIGYAMTIDMLKSDSLRHYIDLGVLPEGDYTVEIVMTLGGFGIGATVTDPTYYSDGFAFGEYKVQMAYAANGDGTVSIPMSERYYISNGSATKNPLYADTAYAMKMQNYTVMRDVTENVAFDGKHTTGGDVLLVPGTAGTVTTATYTTVVGGDTVHSFSTDSVYVSGGTYNDTIAMPTGDDSLVVANNTPCTVYSIRVYDRTLTEGETRQNYVTDLSNAYGGLATDAFYSSSLSFSAEDLNAFYEKLYLRGYNYTQKETQAFFDEFAIATAMTFNGIAVDFSGNNGIRAIFSVRDAAIQNLEKSGYTVEYGIMGGYADTYASFADLTVDKTQNAVRIVAYKTGEEDKGYFLYRENGISTFSFTTYWGKNASMEDVHRNISYRGYMILTKDGNSTTLYLDGDTSSVASKPSYYDAVCYFYNNGYKENGVISGAFEEYKEYVHIYVTADSVASGYLGTGSKSEPFADIQDGFDAAVRAINEGPIFDVIIHLDRGAHVMESELYMNGKEILAEDYSITFEGIEDSINVEDGASVSATVSIPGSYFTEVEGKNYYMYELPDSAKDENGEYPLFRDLYSDGMALALAATEKDRFVMFLDSCKQAGNYGLNPDDRLLYVSPAAVAGIEVDEDYNVINKDLEFWVKTEWQVHAIHVEQVLFDAKRVYQDPETLEWLVPIRIKKADWDVFAPSSGYYATLENRPYWMANDLSYLTEDEFYYDRFNGIIYCNTSDIEDVTISYPVSERLFHLEDIKNISFENVNMWGTTANIVTTFGFVTGQGGYIKIVDPATGERFGFLPYGAIYGNNVDNISINECIISNVGDDCVNFRGGVSNVSITNCTFENIGGSAIRFGNNTPTYNEEIYNRDIVIRNNYIRGTGQIFPSNAGILVASVLNLDLSYNHILESNYSGISIGWSWSSQATGDPDKYDTPAFVNVKYANVSHNYIEDFMTGMADGGAIYVLGGNATAQYTEYLNTINNNVVVLRSNIAAGATAWTVFYHDQGSSHWDDYDNMLLIEEDMRPVHQAYISYQTIAHSYNNRTRRLYIVGYVKDMDQTLLDAGYPRDDDGNLAYDPNDTEFEQFIGVDVSAVGRLLTYYTKDERGNLIQKNQLDGYRYYIDEETGAYDLWLQRDHDYIYDKNGELKNIPANNFIEEIYLYSDYDDERITDEANAAMEEIFNNSGCDFAAKNYEYGEMPPYSGE